MLAESSVSSVKATHNFKGSNNDELCFKKGDVITVTQALEGGWWEGTLNGVTGWFPSNYVKEIKQDTLKMRKSVSYQPETPLSPKLDTLKMYRGIVFKDIVDTESNHLNELQNLVNNYLNALQDGHVLNEDDYALLRGNIDDVLACNIGFLKALEEVQEKPPKEQKIGGIFMQVAPQMKKVNFIYCSNHPKAASTIDKHKDELEKFMEEHGATSPGLLTLTTGLSSPFRRLEKYPALLQELQRHTEESHIDRGDTQRAIFVFRDLAAACLNIRRQKENELEVMSGNIRGWEGEDIQSLGEILHMGLVVFLTEDQEKKDRYLVVFPRTLVILSVSPRMSAFIYEGKLPLSGVTVKKLDPSEGYQFAFEINGNMIQRIIVICASQEILEQWLNLFQSVGNTQIVSPVAAGPKCSSHSSPSHSLQAHSPVGVPQQQLPYNHCNNTVIANEDRSSPQINRTTTEPRINNKVWTSWSLMPHPPMRPNLSANKGEVMLRRSNSRRKEKVPEEKNYEGDMKILQVIEAYCTSAKSRYTVNSAFMDTPNIMIAEEEEEEIIIEEFQGESTIIEEKNLVETICALKDQIQELKLETCQLFKNMDEEKRARQRLELLFQKYMLTNCQDTIATHFKD